MSRLERNILYNLLGQGLVLVLGFVAVRYVFRRLGSDAFGIILFTQAMSYILVAVLELGVSLTAVREVSAHFQDEPAYVRDLLQTGAFLYWTAYGLVSVAILFLAPVIVAKWINLTTLDPSTAARVLQILGVSVVLALPRSLYASLFRGLQRMAFNNIADVTVSGVQQSGTIAILLLGGTVFQVAYWLAATYGVSILVYMVGASRFVPWQALIPRYSASVVRRNLRFALHTMSISTLATVHMQADKLVVSKLLPIGMLGYYSVASTVASRSTLVTGAVAQAAFPSFSELFHRGDRPGLLEQYRKLHDLVSYASVPVLTAVTFAALPLLTYMFNPSVAHDLLIPVGLLCLGFYLNATLSVPYIFSLAVGKPEIAAKQNLLALFIVPPTMVGAVYFFGMAGAAFSWVLYHLFAYVYGVPRFCRQCMKIPVSSWYLHIGKILILVGGTYGVAGFLVALAGGTRLPTLGVAYLGASLAFLYAAYLFMGRELRETLLRLPRSWRTASAQLAP